jgi:hypothetical protein
MSFEKIGKSFDLADTSTRKTATAILGEEDFLSQQEIDDGSIEPEGEAEMRVYIGLSVTVRKDTSLESQLKLAETANFGGGGSGDPVQQLQLVRGLVDTMAEMVVDWSIKNGGVKFEPTAENMRKLPWDLFQAVAKTATKAMSQGRMDPKSVRS